MCLAAENTGQTAAAAAEGERAEGEPEGIEIDGTGVIRRVAVVEIPAVLQLLHQPAVFVIVGLDLDGALGMLEGGDLVAQVHMRAGGEVVPLPVAFGLG